MDGLKDKPDFYRRKPGFDGYAYFFFFFVAFFFVAFFFVAFFFVAFLAVFFLAVFLAAFFFAITSSLFQKRTHYKLRVGPAPPQYVAYIPHFVEFTITICTFLKILEKISLE
jgi:hypothetical protein